MVQFGYDTDDEDIVLEPASQKYNLRKPICPYICSTPLDFDRERSYLSEEIFPKIHSVCHERGTAFSPVDIQWKPDGVQTESGQLLRINFEFISKCSPFFICLLGETYGPHRSPDEGPLPDSLHSLPDDAGWLDKNYLVAASAGYSWIMKEEQQNCSVPELEIIQAAFLADNRHCHFYYRQPEHLDHLFEGLFEEEIEEKSRPFKPVNEYADLNIRDLKQRIVNKGLPVKYFRTQEQLGAHVLADWLEIVNEIYPPLLDGPALIDNEEYREWLAHEVFSDSRRHLYVSHAELRTLSDHMTQFCSTVLDDPYIEEGEEPIQHYQGYSISNILRKKPEVTVKSKSIMVVKGEKGIGKSSLVCNWVKHFTYDNPEVKVISHYVGASGRARDVTTFMRHCVVTMRQQYLEDETDNMLDEEMLKQSFEELCGSFQAAISLGPCVLLLDGVDELGESLGLSPQEVKKFTWLPLPLPAQCRIVMTTCTSDYSHTQLSSRPDIQFLRMSNINTTKIKAELLEDHMQMHYDHLNRSQIQTLLESKLSGRPLFLRIVGNEMSNYSVYTELDVYTESIREMCTSVRDLYVRCFKRWSHDHSWSYEVMSAEQTEKTTADFIGWVPDVLRLLAVSRSGLTANEILEILEVMGYQENVKVTQFDWLMFRLCLGHNVTESPYGVFNFSHQHLREVVEYLLLRTVKPSTAEIISKSDIKKDWKRQKTEFHKELVDYFMKKPTNQRRTEELPWQLLMSGDMDTLKMVLSQPEMFMALYNQDGSNQSNYTDLKTYWYYLEKEGHSLENTYLSLLEMLGVVSLQHEEQLEVQSIDDNVSEIESDDSLEVQSSSTPSQITLFTPVTNNVPTILATPATDHKLSVIEEASDIMSRDERGSKEDMMTSTEHLDTVFLTQNGAQEEAKYDISCGEVTSLAWFISQFFIQQGHINSGEITLVSLNSRLMKLYPLDEKDQLTQVKVQECLGELYLDRHDIDLAERWYKKALRSIMDLFDTDDKSPVYSDLQVLKCKVIQQIGYLRMEEGMLDNADDLLEEALELAEVTRKLTIRATVHFHIGNLRMKQYDYLMAETNLRKSLILRQKWYGRSHPLVADVCLSLASLMADTNNDKGYDRPSAEDLYRRCLDIRERHFDKHHLFVAEVLFELGKFLKCDTTYAGRTECHRLLTRALDIRITKLGGDHIDTKAVRLYITNLEAKLKSVKHDGRSSDRPFSNLSWRGNDLANMERRSQLHSGKSSTYGASSYHSRPASRISRTGSAGSRPPSQSISRPVSGQMDYTGSMTSIKSNSMAYLPASERLLLETVSKPRLLNRESMERKLKNKGEISPQYSPRHLGQPSPSDETKRQLTIEISSPDDKLDTAANDDALLDSYAVETDRTSTKIKSSQEEIPGRETPQQRLFRRYGSPQGMTDQQRMIVESPLGRHGEFTYRTNECSAPVSSRKETAPKPRRPFGSARSIGSSLYTSASAMSNISSKSHKSNCDIPKGPHSLHISNTLTTTMGPHSSVKSLLGERGPKDISKGIHHKSAWYHVPGRYRTVEKKYPDKRSQAREEAKELKKSVPPTQRDSYEAFMKSDYRKNNPQNISRAYMGTGGHTCTRGQAYPPYPRHDKKQYVVCGCCQQEAEEIMAAQEREILGIVDGSLNGADLAPTVNGLAGPDRPQQVGYVIDEPITAEEMDYTYPHVGTMVKFKDQVVMN